MSNKSLQRFLSVLLVLVLFASVFQTTQVTAQEPKDSNWISTTLGDHIEVEQTLVDQLNADPTSGYLIYFRDRPDLSSTKRMTWEDRGNFVYQALRDSAQKSQASVQAFLDQQGISYKAFWIDNVISVEGSNQTTIQGLSTFSEIETLRAKRTLQLIEPKAVEDVNPQTIESNLTHVGATDVWAQGVTGQGIVVANIDTGVRYSHEVLIDHYRGNLGGGEFDHNYNWLDPYGQHPDAPADDNGHGSHTMGTMVGSDGGSNQTGMAPGSTWMACRGCSTEGCTSEALLACAQFITAPTDLNGNNPDPTKRAHVVNNSWGDCGRSYDPWYQGVVDAWQAAGVYPTFANGNSSNCMYNDPPGLNTVANPGRYANVTGVGATSRDTSEYATFSNWGPTDDFDFVNSMGFPAMKPQVVAPGANIRSSVGYSDNGYGVYSGTSMATPHVSGLIALMWSAASCLVGDYYTTETILQQTAAPIPYDSGGEPAPGEGNVPNYATGWGEIRAVEAVNASIQNCESSGTLIGTVTSGGTPIAGVKIVTYDADSLMHMTETDSDGTFTMRLPVGIYQLELSKFGFETNNVSGIEIKLDSVTEVNFVLTQVATSLIQGSVVDANTGWPIYARISISGAPIEPIWTDPVTGLFEIELPANLTYQFSAEAFVDGYLPAIEAVTPTASVMNIDIRLVPDTQTCTAPGYQITSGVTESFDSKTVPDDWSVIDNLGTDQVWKFDSIVRSNDTGGEGNFAIVDSGYYGWGGQQDTELRTPVMDFSNVDIVPLEFKQSYLDEMFDDEIAQVDVSNDNGLTWQPVWTATSEDRGPQLVQIDISEIAANKSQVIVRFHYYQAEYAWLWEVDDVRVAPSCQPIDGLPLVGNIYDENTDIPINGAEILISTAKPGYSAATPEDDHVPDGFYSIVVPAGFHEITASARGYKSVSRSFDIRLTSTLTNDFYLPAAVLEAQPPAITATAQIGSTTNLSFDLINRGGNQANFEIRERDHGMQPLASSEVLVVTPEYGMPETWQAMETGLTANGFTYQEITDRDFEVMTIDQLSIYPVIFYAGSTGHAPLFDEDPQAVIRESLLESYLDAGGNLYISSESLGTDRGHTLFYQKYLQAEYGSVAVVDPFLKGEDIMAGLDFDSDRSSDTFAPLPEGTPIFRFRNNELGGIKVERGDYRAIYTSFDFRYIVQAEIRDELVRRIMDYLGSSSVEWMDVSTSSTSISPGASLQINTIFDATALTVPGTYHAQVRFHNDSPYGDLVVPAEFVVTPPNTWGKIEGTIQSLGYCSVNPVPLEQAEIQISGTNTTYNLITDKNGHYQLWLPESESPLSINVAASGNLPQAISNILITGGSTMIQNADLVLDQPCVSTIPTGLQVSLPLASTTTATLTLTNAGPVSTGFELFEGYQQFSPAINQSAVTGGQTSRRIELTAQDVQPAESVNALPMAASGPLEFAVDDGSFEQQVGLIGGGQFIWLNRFTPTVSDFPLVIDQVSLIFGDSVSVGERIELAVYTDNDSDPANGTELLGTQWVTVQFNDGITWNQYLLEKPVLFLKPGDILIGAINRDGKTGFEQGPAALDDTMSSERSWVGIYPADPPEPPIIPADGGFALIDGVFMPGNWMIRASGYTGSIDIPWFSEEPASGTLGAGIAEIPVSQEVTVTFDSNYVDQPGEYSASAFVKSLDPVNSMLEIPVTMIVEKPISWGAVTGVVKGLGYCDQDPAPLANAAVTITDSSNKTFTTKTNDDGQYTWWLDSLNSPVTVTFSAGGHLSAMIENVAIAAGLKSTQNVELRWQQPCVNSQPLRLSSNLVLGQSEVQSLSLDNQGAATADFEILESLQGFTPMNKPAAAIPGTIDISKLALSYAWPEGSYPAQPWASSGPIELLVDNGSAETGVGLIAGGQFLWLNRFTPDPADFPFVLDHVYTFFDPTVEVGDPFDIVIYSDDDNDPRNGATYLYSQRVTAQANNLSVWNNFALETPVLITGPGDVLIALVNRDAKLGIEYRPASLDTSTSKHRSWVGIYSGDPPDPPQLPADNFALLEEAGLSGNWTLRASGIKGGMDVFWLGEEPPLGSISEGSAQSPKTQSVNVTIDAGKVEQPGDYNATLLVKTNDPVNQITYIPVDLQVEPPATWGKLTGTVKSLGYCDVNPAPAEKAQIEITDLNGVHQTVTDTSGNFSYWLDSVAAPASIRIIYPDHQEKTGDLINVAPGGITTQNFELRFAKPCIQTAPSELSVQVVQGSQKAVQVELTNSGGGSSEIVVAEKPAQVTAPTIASSETEIADGNNNPSVVTGWQKAAPMPTLMGYKNYGSAQCANQTDSFYIIGGSDYYEGSNHIYRYDSDLNQWTELAPMPEALELLSAVCYQDKIYVLGGSTGFMMDTGDYFYTYDITADSWTINSPLPRMAIGAAAGVWDGKIYLAGGDQDVMWGGLTDQVDIYEIETGVWSTGTSMPAIVSESGFAQIDQYLYVVGGWGEMSPDVNMRTTFRYDMANDVWESGPEFASARANFGLAATKNRLYAMGGDTEGMNWFDPSNLVEVLDLTTWPQGQWVEMADRLPVPIFSNTGGFCTTALSGGEIWNINGLAGDLNFEVPNPRWTKMTLYHQAEKCPNEDLDIPWLSESPQTDFIDTDSSAAITVTFTADQSMQPGSVHKATLRIRTNDPEQPFRFIPVTMTVIAPTPGVNLTPEIETMSGNPGQTVAYTLHITNTREIEDTFTIQASGMWTATPSLSSVNLAAGASTDITIEVVIPAGAAAGEVDATQVKVVSSTETSIQDWSVLNTTVNWRCYMPAILN